MNFLFPKTWIKTTSLAAATLGGFLLFAGVAPAKADGWDNCNRRASYSEFRYREAVEHHGLYSREARHWAHERAEARACMERYRHDWRHY